MSNAEQRACQLVQNIYHMAVHHMADLCDDTFETPLWAIKDVEAAIIQAQADERRRVYEDARRCAKTTNDPFIYLSSLRCICGLGGDDD